MKGKYTDKYYELVAIGMNGEMNKLLDCARILSDEDLIPWKVSEFTLLMSLILKDQYSWYTNCSCGEKILRRTRCCISNCGRTEVKNNRPSRVYALKSSVLNDNTSLKVFVH